MAKLASSVLTGYGTTVFEVMSRLALEHAAINLGQGFPDQDRPPDILETGAAALTAGPSPYPPRMGLPELRQAVAAHGEHHYGLALDWRSEVMVTSGTTGALADCLLALIEPGDSVVLIEPLFDSYLPMVRRVGIDRDQAGGRGRCRPGYAPCPSRRRRPRCRRRPLATGSTSPFSGVSS